MLLGRVLNGEAAVNTATRSATINIPANDDPFGVVQFNQSSIFVEERDVDYFIRIPIKRTRGLFGTIRVFYRFSHYLFFIVCNVVHINAIIHR